MYFTVNTVKKNNVAREVLFFSFAIFLQVGLKFVTTMYVREVQCNNASGSYLMNAKEITLKTIYL